MRIVYKEFKDSNSMREFVNDRKQMIEVNKKITRQYGIVDKRYDFDDLCIYIEVKPREVVESKVRSVKKKTSGVKSFFKNIFKI